MKGSAVYAVLTAKGVDVLHHANTVITSCSFFQVGGLASRAHLQAKSLPQTYQYTDADDQKYGIWNDIFLDGTDIHARGSIRNNYGPVLFMLPPDMLLALPPGTDVMVTKKNPAKWISGEPNTDRYFASISELQIAYRYGDFGQHIVLRPPRGLLPFSSSPIQILLDDPRGSLSNGSNAFRAATAKLNAAAAAANLKLNIQQRQCNAGCKCLSGHRFSYASTNLDSCF